MNAGSGIVLPRNFMNLPSINKYADIYVRTESNLNFYFVDPKKSIQQQPNENSKEFFMNKVRALLKCGFSAQAITYILKGFNIEAKQDDVDHAIQIISNE